MNNTIRVDLVQEIVSMARNWGLSEGGATIYAALALSGRSLNMNELQTKTGYSLSSVSTHLKGLTDKYLVTKMKRDGVYVYKAETHFEEIFRVLTRELLERNILPLYSKLVEFKNQETGDLYQHLSTLEGEMQKLIDYLTKITHTKGEIHATEKDNIIMSSVP